MSQVENTYVTRLVDRFLLNKSGASREAWHIVLEVPQGFPAFRPGDSIGIYPKNAASEVLPLLDYFNLQGDSSFVDKKGRVYPVSLWLSECAEIGRVTTSLLKAIVREAFSSVDRERLSSFSEGESEEIFAHYTLCRFLREYVPGGVSFSVVARHIPSLMPRLYSIASGPSQSQRGLELIVARVCYEHKGTVRRGVCSRYLIEGASPHSEIRMFHNPTKHFLFPEQDTPLVMVGAGTGIAPFRAYMQEVESRKFHPRECWLFFGERKSSADFFYEEFWKKQQRERRLKMALAFSCDQEHKIYVQHRMWEERKELWRWLDGGACLYVCGHAKKMAHDVEVCLFDIAREQGGLKDKLAEEWLVSMKQTGRYLKDVY